jgi:hypothetical protein
MDDKVLACQAGPVVGSQMFVREVPLKKEVPLGAKAGLAAIRSEAAKMSCVLVMPVSPGGLVASIESMPGTTPA